MPRGRESINEFTEELREASQALSDFQSGLADAIEAANEAAEGAAGQPAGGDAGPGASRAGREAKKERGLGDIAGKFAKRAAIGAVGGALVSAARSIRSGTDVVSGFGSSIAAAAAFVVPGLGNKIDAAQLAGQRTANITGPLARFGVDVRKEDRERQFAFENALAEREVDELAEVKKLTERKDIGQLVNKAGETGEAFVAGDGPQTVTILGRILDVLTQDQQFRRSESGKRGGSPR